MFNTFRAAVQKCMQINAIYTYGFGPYKSTELREAPNADTYYLAYTQLLLYQNKTVAETLFPPEFQTI